MTRFCLRYNHSIAITKKELNLFGMNTSLYWLALHSIPGINKQVLKHILQNLSSDIEKLFSLNRKQLTTLKLSPKSIDAILNVDLSVFQSDIKWLQTSHHHLIEFNSPYYPSLLKKISNPPLVLFVMGELDCLKTPQIAVIGSRTPSYTGLSIATEFSEQLVDSGLTITSGLAYGIDKAAHQGAINKKGKTIAVLGSGLKRIYPFEHGALVKKIIQKGGAIISELPLQQAPLPFQFPKRNRIISGLSLGVVIIEAALKSGSLITANQAVEANREVFAVPGSIKSHLSRGCHKLIQQGAKLVSNVDEILEELQISLMNPRVFSKEKIKSSSLSLDSAHQKLLKCIGYEPLSINELIERSELTVEKVTVMLITLEVSGYIQSTLKGYLKI